MLTNWWKSLRWQLGAVLASFAVCLSVMLVTMGLALQTQRADSARLAVANRQQQLLPQMAWLALADPASPTLTEAETRFTQNLLALRDGGQVFDTHEQWEALPPAPPALRAQIDALTADWNAWRTALHHADPAALTLTTPALQAQLEMLVSAFEAEAQAHQQYWQNLEFICLVVALLLLGGVLWLIWRRVVLPLARLNASAQRFLAGEQAPLPSRGPEDLGALSQAFEVLRAEVTAAREHLEAQVAQRTRELTAVFEISQEMVAQQQPAQLLQSVAEHARTLTQAEAVSVCLLNPGQTELWMAAQAGGVNHPSFARHTLAEDPALRVISRNETVTAEAACSACSFLQAHGPGPCIAAPLRTGAVTLGAVCAVRAPARPFDPHETRAFTLLANSAAVALTNAHLLESVQQQAKDKAALAEREHLSAELHDHVAQTLGFMKLKAEHIQALCAQGRATEADADLARLQSALAMVYGQVRSVLTGLREPPFPASPLRPRLEQCIAEFQAQAGVPVTLTLNDDIGHQLPALAQTQVVHIVREALTNIRRHARAHQVHIQAAQANGRVSFTIQDDGVGFAPTQAASDHHLGLNIMRTRAERSGGGRTVESTPGAGTTITAWFPATFSP